MSFKTLTESEHAKAGQVLQDMLDYLNRHPERHTPFMDRWFELCVGQNTMVYAIRKHDGAVGRRLLHGTPERVVECIESAERFGKKNVWFVKVVR